MRFGVALFRLFLICFCVYGACALAVPPAKPVKPLIPAEALQAEKNEDWQKALNIYLKILVKEPQRSDLWMKVAYIESLLKNFDLSINAYQRAIQLQPKNHVLHKGLSEVYAMKNKPDLALVSVTEAVKLAPNNPPYLLALAEIANWNKKDLISLESYARYYQMTQKTNTKEENLRLLELIAMLSSRVKNYQQEIMTYQAMLQLDPEKIGLYPKLAVAYQHNNDANNALMAINKALETEPENYDYLMIKLRIAIASKNNALMLETIKKLTAIVDTPDKKLHILIDAADIAIEDKNYPMAVDMYRQVLQKEPKKPVYYERISQIYSAMNEPANAMMYLDYAIKLDPKNENYLKSKVTLANWLQDYTLAIATLQQLSVLYESKGKMDAVLDAQLQIARLYTQLKKYPEAVTAYQYAISIKSDSAPLYQELSQLYASTEQPQEAFDAINKAIELDPKNIEYLRSKASIANWLKKPELAVASYEEVLKLNPKDPMAMNMIREIKQQNQGGVKGGGKGGPGRPLTAFEQLNADADIAASKKQYTLAAEKIRKAIQMHPGDAKLYKKLSEIYSMGNQPQNALNAMLQATAMEPNNIPWLRAQGDLASWSHNLVVMQKTYERILFLKPYDEQAMYKLALAINWQGNIDLALAAYQKLLKRYPNNADAWLDYANTTSWVGRMRDSMNALEQYRRLKGPTEKYLKDKASILASAEKYESARAINEGLFFHNPKDPTLLKTEILIFNQALQKRKAVDFLKEYNRLQQNSKNKETLEQLAGLNEIILTPVRTNVKLAGDYITASDTTKILDIPFVAQYFLTPATSLQFLGLYERAAADVGSGLETFYGTSDISDASAMVGIIHQIPALMDLSANAGMLKIQNGNTFGIYNASINIQPTEDLTVTFQSLYNLFRPYLVPQSPRSISLEIRENRNSLFFQWQPFLQTYLDVLGSHGELSRNNAYWHFNVWPKALVYGSQNWRVTAGINGDFWQFRRRAVGEGYYSPLHFDGYEGTLELYYTFSNGYALSISTGIGLQKDETYPHYYYQEDYAFQLMLGVYSDWELRIKGGYTLRTNPQHNNYNAWSGGLVLTRRFDTFG